MRVADPHDFPFVLEDQHERHVRMRCQLPHLVLPGLEQRVNLPDVQLGERQVVPRTVTDDSRHARGRTRLLVSHRMAALRGADLIVTLVGGRIAEQGSHDELMDADGEYARLFRLQADGYQDARVG